MGRQHGELLKAYMAKGPLPYFQSYVQRMARRTALGAASPAVLQAVQQILGRSVAKRLPEHVLDGVRGLAEGSQMPYGLLLGGCTMPDSLLWCASRLMQVRRIGPAMHHRLALGLGCTSAVAWGAATRDGRLLHARNLDYFGVGNWPQAAAVIFHEPARGQRYVSVAAAGVMFGGVTAMNEAGLTLTVHQHMFTDKAALGGTPIGVVGDEVMRDATTLEEAQAILGRYRPIGCWTYLIGDGHGRRVLCHEENPERAVDLVSTPADATFGYANIYLDPVLGASEKNLYGSYWRANLGRHQRANALLAARSGQLDPTGMAAILADIEPSGCRLRASIAMLLTVGSVVFRPEDGALWVSTGEAPTSRNPFVPFHLGSQDHAPELGELTEHARGDGAEREAFEAYRRAYMAYFDAEDVAESRRQVARCRALQPEESLYHCLAGLLALADGDPGESLQAFGRALELGHPDGERVSSFHLWRARAADLAGRRSQALGDYRRALGGPVDLAVQRAAERGLKRPYSAKRASRMAIDFAYADVVAP
jgi:tetratricopeptide (TPR) repeat protein